MLSLSFEWKKNVKLDTLDKVTKFWRLKPSIRIKYDQNYNLASVYHTI